MFALVHRLVSHLEDVGSSMNSTIEERGEKRANEMEAREWGGEEKRKGKMKNIYTRTSWSWGYSPLHVSLPLRLTYTGAPATSPPSPPIPPSPTSHDANPIITHHIAAMRLYLDINKKSSGYKKEGESEAFRADYLLCLNGKTTANRLQEDIYGEPPPE
jgi:hypothetical protein